MATRRLRGVTELAFEVGVLPDRVRRDANLNRIRSQRVGRQLMFTDANWAAAVAYYATHKTRWPARSA